MSAPPHAEGFVVGPDFAVRAAAAGASVKPMAQTLCDALCTLGVRIDRADFDRLASSSGTVMNVSEAARLVTEAGLSEQLSAGRVDAGVWADALGLVLARRQREAHDAASAPEPTGAIRLEREPYDSHQFPPPMGAAGFVVQARERWRRDE